MRITPTVNGQPIKVEVAPNETLVDMLRNRLHLTGTREGCGVGLCGSCTVLVDGRAVSSCILLATNVDGREVLTIEGLGNPDHLDPVQEAFLDHQAFQCGYCTPGMILTVKALLADGDVDASSEKGVRDYLSGNICRCGTYAEVLEVVRSLHARRRARPGP